MYCPNCGAQTNQEENFCASCGENLKENTTNNQTVAVDSQPYVQNQAKSDGLVYKILGWVFFAISLLFIPILFGAGAFIMGYLLRKSSKHNETHGTILMVMGIAGGILGMLLGLASVGY